MSYLLGYQKWRKLHESAKYGKIYEQAFSKTPAQFVIIGGTDPTPINDATLHTETGIPNGAGVALYEISIKDALNNNFSAAKKIKDLTIGSKNEQDQFQIVDATGNPISGLEMQGQAKSVTFTYTPKSSYKIRFSGNGILAMHRAVLELGDLITASKTLSLDSHVGHIRLYMNHVNSPVPLSSSKSGRLGIGATNIGTMPTDAQIAAELLTNCIAPAVHYLLSDQYKEGFKASYPQSFKSILVNSLSDRKPLYDGQILKDRSYSLLTSDGAFMTEGEAYSALDSLKGKTPDELLKPQGDNDDYPLPKKDATGKRAVFLKNKIRIPIYEYAKTCLTNFAADGSTIDTYFKLKLKGADDDLINTLSTPVKNHYKKAVSKFNDLPLSTGAFAQLYIDKQTGKSGDSSYRTGMNVPKGETSYEPGKSGSGGTKASTPQTPTQTPTGK